MSRPSRIKWWLGGIAWDIAMNIPFRWKLQYWLTSFAGHRYAFATYQEWINHYKYMGLHK